MSRTVVSTVPDQRPIQSGLEVDALPFDGSTFDALMDAAALDQLQSFLGDSLAFALGQRTEVRVEPTADPVKISVPDAALPAGAPRVRQ